MSRKDGGMVRSNRLLYRKFSQYLVPTMITYAALSLNDFVDSMVVSNLLGSEAMAVVNLGLPAMMVMSAAYALLGNGGETAYAIAVGKRDRDSAGKHFTGAVTSAFIIGLALFLLGVLFSDGFAGLLCSDRELLTPFRKYLFVLLLSAPLMVVTLTVLSFLPAAGYPGITTTVNVISNVINITMDYVYIRIFHMGVEGAAWATFTGYVCAAAILAGALLTGRVKMYVSRDIKGSLARLKEVLRFGSTDAANQIGLSAQFAVCNRLAMAAAGTSGVVAYSLCLQSAGVMTVFLGAMMGSSVPMLAILHGQRDYHGEKGIRNTALTGTLITSVIGTVLFIAFASQIALIYNITDPARHEMAVTALRIYSLLYIPRYTVIILYQYLKVIGLNRYSTIMSALDSFAAVIPVALIMVKIKGITGLWAAFPLTAIMLLAAMLICNLRIASRSGGRLKGPLLTESDEEGSKPVLDVTIEKNSAEIAGISEELQRICEDMGMDRKKAALTALAVEEIAVNAAARKDQSAYSDLLVRIHDGRVEIDFRSLGKAFDPLEADDGVIEENIAILRSMASGIENEYLMGMNSTRITLGERPA